MFKTLGTIILILSTPLSSALEIRIEKQGFHIEKDGETITSLRTDYRIPYLYPVTSPSGANVARHWPMEDHIPSENRDHPHHRGIWTAHGNVNGYDFWADESAKNARIVLVTIKDITTDTRIPTVECTFNWMGATTKLLSEQRRYTFSYPSPETLRIDILSTLTAVAPKITFGDTKEGTVGFRSDRTLRVDGPEARAQLTTSEGLKNNDAWGTRAQWAAYSGPDEKGEPTVIAMLNQPDSFRYPTYWHARTYGLLAANPFGIHDFTEDSNKNAGQHILSKDDKLTLHHTVVIHHGTLPSIDLNEHIHPAKP